MTDKRTFGSVRKLPSGRWQARYTAPNGANVTAPATFAAKIHAETWLGDRKREIDTNLWNPAAAEQHGNGSLSRSMPSSGWRAARSPAGPSRKGPVPTTPASSSASCCRRSARGADRDHAGRHPRLVRQDARRQADDAGPHLRLAEDDLRHRDHRRADRHQPVPYPRRRQRQAGPQGHAGQRHRDRDHHRQDARRLQLAVTCASWLAMRLGETLELRRGDVDLDAGVVRIRRGLVRVGGRLQTDTPKTDAGVRDVAIPPHLIDRFRDHLAEHTGAGDDALLFPSAADPARWLQSKALYKDYRKARAAAGRDDLRWHDLRHSGAVLAATAGATLAELMARLGHSTPAAAMRYQHAAEGRDHVVAAKMSKLAATHK